MAVTVGRKSGDSGGLRRLSMDKMQGGRRRRSRVRGFSEGEMTWRRKSSEGGGSGSALMTDGERKRKGGSVSHGATRRDEDGGPGTACTRAGGGR
jgi:hypothetical protein